MPGAGEQAGPERASASRGAVRQPAVAGMFYPATDDESSAVARQLISASPNATDVQWIGGSVPQAGWICRGAVPGATGGTPAARTTPAVAVVFGAVQTTGPEDQAVLSTYSAPHAS